jgi:predicted kinase
VHKLGVVPPVLIAMCGLGFSGKSVLARTLSQELGLRVLCYDTEIYEVHRRLVLPGSSVAAGYDFVQDIAREQIAVILAAGQSLIYDDLLLEHDDRRKLAAVARDHRAELVLVYLDTPLPVINQRRAENTGAGTRADMSEAKLRLDASLLEPPGRTERAIYVRPADPVADVMAKIRARLPRPAR